MGYCKPSSLPVAEPVTVDQAKAFLRLPSGTSSQDSIIAGFITGARVDGERESGRILAQREFTQVLDSFPFYTDTVQSQLAFTPNYYSAPRYSTTLWNYSQMIKLQQAPVMEVTNLTYIDASGNPQVLVQGVDFILDPETELARVFPFPGRNWPPCQYTPNALLIEFTAGYDPDPTATITLGLPSPPPSPPNQQTQYTVVSGIPQVYVDGILNVVAFKFNNRGVAVPDSLFVPFRNNGILDFAPTRG